VVPHNIDRRKRRAALAGEGAAYLLRFTKRQFAPRRQFLGTSPPAIGCRSGCRTLEACTRMLLGFGVLTLSASGSLFWSFTQCGAGGRSSSSARAGVAFTHLGRAG
jgi:hypothetical protein